METAERALQLCLTTKTLLMQSGSWWNVGGGKGKERKKNRNEVETRVRERKYLRDEKKLPYGRILLFNLIFKGLQLSH